MSHRKTIAATAISAIMRPRTVLILGASAKRQSSGNEAIRNLLAAGFPPQSVQLVHPTAEEIEGLRIYPSIEDLPSVPDVALLAIPAPALRGAIEQLARIGCPAAIVPGAGLTDAEQSELRDLASQSSVAVVGNNCMGVLSVADRTPLWFYEGILTDLPAGPIALVSQSGSATFLARAVDGVGFSRIISTGNEIDLTSADYLRWLAQDPATRVVGVVVESIRDSNAFQAAIADLRRAGKPVVALKVGSTAAGAQATVAHTGALMSSSAATESFFARLDVPVVSDYDELAVSLQLLAHPIRPQGPGIAVITDSGGEAALAADLAESAEIALTAFSAETIRQLQRLVPNASIGNPFDAGASPLTTDEQYDEAFLIAAQDPSVDAIAVIIEAHASAPDRETRFSVEMVRGGISRAQSTGKPVIAMSSSTSATHPVARKVLGGVPLLRGIKPGLVALRAAAGNRVPLPVTYTRPAHLPTEVAIQELGALLASQRGGVVMSPTAATVLRAYGIPMVESTVAVTPGEAVAWAAGRYPVVAKVASPDIAHRSDIGAVVTGIPTPDELVRAYERIHDAVTRHAPASVVEGIEIQAAVPAGREALVGVASDPALGNTVLVGTGGVLVELIDDTRASLVPVTPAEARRLVEETALGALMAGYRSLAPVTPTDPLVDLIERLSWLAHDFSSLISEIDLNPVIIEHGTGRLAIVDALIAVHPTHAGTVAPVPHAEGAIA